VVNADYCESGVYDLSRRRNILFTALTRAKAWVRVCGVGPLMQNLASEMSAIAADEYDLSFYYPTLPELEKIKTSYRERTSKEKMAVKREIKSAEKLLERILSGEVDLAELPPHLADLLRKGMK
jgi:superfamily I DNA and RNA helicase